MALWGFFKQNLSEILLQKRGGKADTGKEELNRN